MKAVPCACAKLYAVKMLYCCLTLKPINDGLLSSFAKFDGRYEKMQYVLTGLLSVK